jgi:hypothetical protein
MGRDIIKNILPALPGILAYELAIWITLALSIILLVGSSC